MVSSGLVSKDTFPTIADRLRHKFHVQSGERPFPLLFVVEKIKIRRSDGIANFFFSKHLIFSVFSLHPRHDPQLHGRAF